MTGKGVLYQLTSILTLVKQSINLYLNSTFPTINVAQSTLYIVLKYVNISINDIMDAHSAPKSKLEKGFHLFISSNLHPYKGKQIIWWFSQPANVELYWSGSKLPSVAHIEGI